jgi:hypothetical protein
MEREMSHTEAIEQTRSTRGIEEAYKEACRTVREQASHLDALWNSRFFERRVLDDGSRKLWPTTEQRVSSAYDLQDLDGEPIPEFLYCDVDGQLYPVTVGAQSRHSPDPNGPDEPPFIYASSDMVANGKVVGTVRYTDH